MPTKSEVVAKDVASLLRARNPLIWIITREEARVEGFLASAAGSAGFKPLFWDVAQGVTGLDGKVIDADSKDCGDALKTIKDAAEVTSKDAERNVWVMRDLPIWLRETPGAAPLRALRNLARLLPSTPRSAAQAVVVITTDSKVPDELAAHATVIEWPLPDRAEIAKVLDTAIGNLPEFENDPETGKPDTSKPLRANAATTEVRELAIDAAVGLTAEEAASCYAKSIVQTRKIDPAVVSNEKKRVISRERVLEWVDPIKGGLDAVGGLDNLKGWLETRRNAYSPEARAYGLPAPKGTTLVGIPGCGKSLTAKCIATSWNVPLLRLDLGALKSKFVGDSEGNLRKALKVIEAIGRCVLWIDEIEKALQGATSGSADGGVSSDALGTILNWMQERVGGAFVIATANDVTSLPPELLRKGRFDEVFFVDLPNVTERKSVLSAALRANGRGKVKIDLAKVATATDGFTGSEIAELVPTALFAAFADKSREITTADLLAAAGDVVPLSKTAQVRITALRKWGAENARSATSAKVAAAAATEGRVLDLE
jgi:AAA+ superfamily predicted ATPase